MKKYDTQRSLSSTKQDELISESLFESMWELFLQIGYFWKNGDFITDANQESYQSQVLNFMNNRIEFDRGYLEDYINAQIVINELVDAFGEQEGYKILFTKPVDTQQPPTTSFERARIKVSNEFVSLQLALGGFASFGAKNYPGYFGGANTKTRTPYRTYKG